MNRNDANIIITLLIMILSKMNLTKDEEKVLTELTVQLQKEARQ